MKDKLEGDGWADFPNVPDSCLSWHFFAWNPIRWISRLKMTSKRCIYLEARWQNVGLRPRSIWLGPCALPHVSAPALQNSENLGLGYRAHLWILVIWRRSGAMSQTFLRIVEVLLGIVHLAERAPLCTSAAAICHLPLTLPTRNPAGHLHFFHFARNPYGFKWFKASLLDQPANNNKENTGTSGIY